MTDDRLRIVVLGLGSPFDETAFSGIPFNALKELRRRNADVHVIDTPRLDKFLLRLSSFCGKRLSFLGLQPIREPIICRLLALIITPRLKALRPDVIVAMSAEHKIVHAPRQYPVILCAGAMFGNIVEYYPIYRRLSRRTIRNGRRQDVAILGRHEPILLASGWAAGAAAESYAQSVARFTVAPWGANFANVPAIAEPRPAAGPLKLLFVGYDWTRKGGDVVLRVFQTLRLRLGDTELHIVGCHPPGTIGIEGVFHHGRLRKSQTRHEGPLELLFRNSSFLIMPSLQEIYGLVFCESMAYGLPPVAAVTGGIGDIIDNGENGVLLSPESTAEDYVDAVLAVWSRNDVYQAMQAAARAKYEAGLNWRAWCDTLESTISELIGTRDRQPFESPRRAESPPSWWRRLEFQR